MSDANAAESTQEGRGRVRTLIAPFPSGQMSCIGRQPCAAKVRYTPHNISAILSGNEHPGCVSLDHEGPNSPSQRLPH